jgi:two-component system sensor kinase
MSEASNTLLQSELKLKEENEKLLQQKQSSQQTLNKFLIIGILLLAALFALLLWQAIVRHKQNKILSTQVEENKLLLNEVHHRVKNNLQIISSFMLLQQAKNGNTENDELLKQLQSKIGALALVHQMLQNQQVHEKVMIKNYFEQLTTQIIATHTNNDNGLQCRVEMDETVLSLDSITSLAFIAIELLLNTIKYVVPYHSITEVLLKARSDKNKLLFTYSDSGSGLPPGIDTNKPTTTGLRLIKRLAVQLGSELETYREAGKFIYKIKIPL